MRRDRIGVVGWDGCGGGGGWERGTDVEMCRPRVGQQECDVFFVCFVVVACSKGVANVVQADTDERKKGEDKVGSGGWRSVS